MTGLVNQTFVFDCDSVLLDSNRVKTEAFRLAALPYGTTAAERLVQHHVDNGGVSRYKKFEHFLEKILPETLGLDGASRDIPDYGALVSACAAAVHEGLRTCAVAEGLEELREKTPHARWLVVSGGDQAELRAVLNERGITDYFDGGIFGSPDSKANIVACEIANGNIKRPALFLGDSRLDHEVAAANGLDFVLVSQWTEMPDWERYLDEYHLTAISGITQLFAAQASAAHQARDS